MLKGSQFLSLIIFLSFSFLAKAFEVPRLTGPVIDEMNLLSSSARDQIENYIRQIRQNNGPQLQVFITSSLQGEEVEQVTIKVFDTWKLGDKGIDNGILFLIAPTARKMRIEVGKGLEGDLPDVIAKRIVADVVAPYFKRQEYDSGVVQGVLAIAKYINATPAEKQQMRQTTAPSASRGFLLGFLLHNPIILIFLVLFILKLFFGGRGGGSGFYGGWGGGGFGGGGGGSWGGGGGSSSGGGASGDW